ncbi:hypothetical protein B0H16DRAFT_1452911 [Mycena metata]|uniref:Uncharacterized protein n=1 Tax=Mycena metata TaxID=1033252 RepID=A0AAD7NNG1_9AGAR|nr:hypothetical protein B0H16DRAFT_1452911 [Mycena metata]
MTTDRTMESFEARGEDVFGSRGRDLRIKTCSQPPTMAKGRHTPANTSSGPMRRSEKKGENGRQNIAKVAEKQRLLMAQRRAAVKAKRRQWDPPKRVTEPVGPQSVSSASSVGPDHQPEDHAIGADTPNILITDSEHFALNTLLDLARTARLLGEDARTSDLDNEDRPVDSGIDLPPGWEPVDNSSEQSVHSSLEAVEKEPIDRRPGDWENAFTKELPFYAQPPNSAQRKMQRELGLIGPLTGTQQMQVVAASLGDPLDGNVSEPEHIPKPSLGQQRRNRILEWRETRFENDWDVASRRSFLEAALSRLYCR